MGGLEFVTLKDAETVDLVLRGAELTVVVLTRPPGCVQVHPDLLTSRSQPSSSKHGTISHHCFFRTIPAAENKGRRSVKRGSTRRKMGRERRGGVGGGAEGWRI